MSTIGPIGFDVPCCPPEHQMSMPGDITLGSGNSWWGPNLTAFVENGTIPLSRMDDMATRIMASYYLLGQDQDYPNGAQSSNCYHMKMGG